MQLTVSRDTLFRLVIGEIGFSSKELLEISSLEPYFLHNNNNIALFKIL